jgi:segregation and condensation protein A
MQGPNEPEASSVFESLVAGERPYAVKLPVFEGPLDLLLHLIRLNEVDVTDIPIVKIAEQYLEYLEVLQDLDLDLAGEYLLMAATLAWIKSRMLLPPEPSESDEEPLDPRSELVARLLEYQRFKEAAGELAELPRLERDVFRVHATGLERTPESEREIAVGVFQLLAAMKQVLAHAKARGATHEVEVETVTVRDRMRVVMDVLSGAASVEFFDVFQEADGGLPSRGVVVATFLAILELARLGAVRIFQGVSESGSPTGPIRLRRSGEAADAWSEGVGELM